MVTIVNFSGSVDRDLLKCAKLAAAQAGGNQPFRALLDFSLGRADERATLARLGVGSEEDLFLLMAQAA